LLVSPLQSGVEARFIALVSQGMGKRKVSVLGESNMLSEF